MTNDNIKSRPLRDLPPTPEGGQWRMVPEGHTGMDIPHDFDLTYTVFLTRSGSPCHSATIENVRTYGNAVRYANSLGPLAGYGWHPDSGEPCPWAPEWRAPGAEAEAEEDPWKVPEGWEWTTNRWGVSLVGPGPSPWACVRIMGSAHYTGSPPPEAVALFLRRNELEAEAPEVEPASNKPDPLFDLMRKRAAREFLDGDPLLANALRDAVRLMEEG